MIARGNTDLSIKDLFKQISEYDLIGYYLGVSEIPCVINSPLRGDKHPSFGLYSKNGERINYVDLSKGDRGGCLDLLMEYFKLNLPETLSKISSDLPKIRKEVKSSCPKFSISPDFESRKTMFNPTPIDLKVKVRDWKDWDLQYWESYGIKGLLKMSGIHPISHFFINKKGKEYIIPADKYAYVYVEFRERKPLLKVYQPFSKEHKWINSMDSNIWNLWNRLPKSGENLIITSSRKDSLCIWENTWIPSTSLQAETNIPDIKAINHLKSRYNNIYVLYDNDFNSESNWGRMMGQKLSEMFGLMQLEIPEELQSKDPSDLYKNYGKIVLKDTIFALIKQAKLNKINNLF